jgi:hypothetical protein
MRVLCPGARRNPHPLGREWFIADIVSHPARMLERGTAVAADGTAQALAHEALAPQRMTSGARASGAGQPGLEGGRASNALNVDLVIDENILLDEVRVGRRRGIDQEDAHRRLRNALRSNEDMIGDYVAGDLAGSPRANLNSGLGLVVDRPLSSNRIPSDGTSGIRPGTGDGRHAIMVEQALLHDYLGAFCADREGTGSCACDAGDVCRVKRR